MLAAEWLAELEPRGSGGHDIEPFASYLSRIQPLLPAWPPEVIEQWVYRHYLDMPYEYGWLLTREECRFALTPFTTAQVVRSIGTHKQRTVDTLGTRILESSPWRSWLQLFMLEHGTWPVPIVLLDNPIGLSGPHGEPFGSPYHLLEGHLRLGYLRTLVRAGHNVPSSHLAWVAYPSAA